MSYTATAHSTIADKEKFEAQFKRFVLDGFPRSKFRAWFYQRLSKTFGHIAHYNCEGFYQTWFDSLPNCEAFITHTLNWGCYGDPAYTYCDVEKELQNWLREERILEIISGVVLEEKRTTEIALRDKLIKKYGTPEHPFHRVKTHPELNCGLTAVE